MLGLHSRNAVDTDLGVSLQEGLQLADDVVTENIRAQVGLRVFLGIEPVQDLHIFVSNQEFLGLRTGDSIEEGLLVLRVDGCRRLTVLVFEFEGDL